MAQRTIVCACGGQFQVPPSMPAFLHCPKCGNRVNLVATEAGAVKVREDIREQIRPLPPSRPWYPLILLVAAGLLLIVSLIALMARFTERVRVLPAVTEEGVRAKPPLKEVEPVISIRAIPAIPLGNPQQIAVQSNTAGLVGTILRLTGKIPEALEMEDLLARNHQAMGTLTAPVDCFQPGDELTALGTLLIDPQHPERFAEEVRRWLTEARPGASSLATVRRGPATVILTLEFPELAPDLVGRLAARKP